MSKGNNSKRSRGRGNNPRRSPRNQVIDSNGPEGRVRGNVQQVYDKYLSMARETVSSDRIVAENMFQHADHYFRMMKDSENERDNRDNRDQRDNRDNREQRDQRDNRNQRDGGTDTEQDAPNQEAGNRRGPRRGRKAETGGDGQDNSGDRQSREDNPDGEELAGVLKEVPIKSGKSEEGKKGKDKDGSDDDSEAAA